MLIDLVLTDTSRAAVRIRGPISVSVLSSTNCKNLFKASVHSRDKHRIPATVFHLHLSHKIENGRSIPLSTLDLPSCRSQDRRRPLPQDPIRSDLMAKRQHQLTTPSRSKRRHGLDQDIHRRPSLGFSHLSDPTRLPDKTSTDRAPCLQRSKATHGPPSPC